MNTINQSNVGNVVPDAAVPNAMNVSPSAMNVLSYTSGVSKPLTGMELLVVSYKTGKDGIKKESKCVNVMPVSADDIIERIEELIPHIQGMVRTARTSMLRELLDAVPEKSLISSNDLSLSAVLEYLENSSESGRMTKVSLGNWFTSELEERLTVAIADKLGVGDVPTMEQSFKMERLVAEYKDKLCALAGGKTAYSPKLATSLIKAVEMVDTSSDGIAAKLYGKLVKMRDTVQVEMIDLL